MANALRVEEPYWSYLSSLQQKGPVPSNLLQQIQSWQRNHAVFKYNRIHPWKLTWNPKMQVWKMIFLFKQVIFRFHVNFPPCCRDDKNNTMHIKKNKPETRRHTITTRDTGFTKPGRLAFCVKRTWGWFSFGKWEEFSAGSHAQQHKYSKVSSTSPRFRCWINFSVLLGPIYYCKKSLHVWIQNRVSGEDV